MNDESKELNIDKSDKIVDNGDLPEVTLVPEEEESNPQAVIKKLRQALKESQKERQEYLEGWQRAKADFVNAKKQEDSDRQSFVKFAGGSLIQSLIPTLRNFNLAMGNSGWESLPETWRKGIEMVRKELLETLAAQGLKETNPVGEIFNPEEHESASTKEV